MFNIDRTFDIVWASWVLFPNFLGFGFHYNYLTIFIWVVFVVVHTFGITGLLRGGAKKSGEKNESAGNGKPVSVQGALTRVVHLVIVASAQGSSNIKGSWHIGWTLPVVMFALGIVIDLSARFSLGKEWRGRVEVREDHALITNGLYKYVRHPIYLGMLMANLGTCLLNGYWLSYFLTALAAASFWIKLKAEEELLLEQFGDQYRRYRTTSKALIPFIL